MNIGKLCQGLLLKTAKKWWTCEGPSLLISLYVPCTRGGEWSFKNSVSSKRQTEKIKLLPCVQFHFCCLPFAVNVKLNLSINYGRRSAKKKNSTSGVPWSKQLVQDLFLELSIWFVFVNPLPEATYNAKKPKNIKCLQWLLRVHSHVANKRTPSQVLRSWSFELRYCSSLLNEVCWFQTD